MFGCFKGCAKTDLDTFDSCYAYIYMLFIDMSIDFDKPKQGSSMFLLRVFIDI